MRLNWPLKIVFWLAIVVSCAWLILAVAIDVAGIRFFLTAGFARVGRGSVEILTVTLLTLQPLLVLFLIVRAIRLSSAGPTSRIVARAFYPLLSAGLFVCSVDGLKFLGDQSALRRMARWTTGSITYVCSTNSSQADFDLKTVGALKLRLTEFRHPGRLSNWIVKWPGKPPIVAVSFHARTGSYGGSEGIKWRDADGLHVFAYLSFSDVLDKNGQTSILMEMRPGDPPAGVPDFVAQAGPNFDCDPDFATYRE